MLHSAKDSYPVSDDERLDLITQIARETGLTIDFLEVLTRGLQREALGQVCNNLSDAKGDVRIQR